MSKVKINSNLHLGSLEINRIVDFIDSEGLRLFGQQIISNFGIVQLPSDINFDNLKIIQGSGGTLLTLQSGIAVDSNLNFVRARSNQADVLTSPNDNTLRYVKIKHAYTNKEEGTVSIAADGTITGTGTEFERVLRGSSNNRPIKIKFPNAATNTNEYTILSVTSDTSAVIQGVDVQVETGLEYVVVGAFDTPSPAPTSKDIYNRDFYQISLELTDTVVSGEEFILASVITSGGSSTITDLRGNYIFTLNGAEGSGIAPERDANPLIGVESIKYDNANSGRDHNIVTLGYGFRPTSWTANAPLNKIEITVGTGGIFLATTDFTNGDFDGWNVHFADGRKLKVVSSTRTGGTITLNFGNYDTTVFSTTGDIVVCPDADFIEVAFTTVSAAVPNKNAKYITPIHNGYVELRVPVGSPLVVTYRNVRGGQTSDSMLINLGNYFNETAYDNNGVKTGSGTTAVSAGAIITPVSHVTDNVGTQGMFKGKDNLVTAGTTLFDVGTFLGVANVLTTLEDSNSIFAGNISLTPKTVAFPPSSVNDNVATFSSAVHNRVTGNPITITGIVAGNDGEILVITPQFTSGIDTNVLILHENSGSVSQNRIHCPTGEGMILNDGASLILRYDLSRLRWIPLVVPSNIVGEVIASMQRGWEWTDIFDYGAGSGSAITVTGGGSVAWSSIYSVTKVQGTVVHYMFKAIGVVTGTVTEISFPALIPLPSGSTAIYLSTHKWMFWGNVYGAKGSGYDYEVFPVVWLNSDGEFHLRRETGNFAGDSGSGKIEIQFDFIKDFV